MKDVSMREVLDGPAGGLRMGSGEKAMALCKKASGSRSGSMIPSVSSLTMLRSSRLRVTSVADMRAFGTMCLGQNWGEQMIQLADQMQDVEFWGGVGSRGPAIA